MNKILSFLIVIVSNYNLSQNIKFTDSLFKKALLNHNPTIDLNNDGEIQVTEAESLKELTLMQKGITNVQEIYYFKNLTELNLNNNELISLKVENLLFLENLYCVANKLESLEVKNLPVLVGIYFGSNKVKSPILKNLPN